MIELLKTTNKQILDSILFEPSLFESVNGHKNIPENKEIDLSWNYIAIAQDKHVIGCFQIKELTKLVLEVHIWLLPEYWGAGISLEIAKVGNQYAREHGYTQLFTKVPANAVHTLHYLNKIGYQACGMIKDGIVFHNYLVSLFFFTLELNHTNL